MVIGQRLEDEKAKMSKSLTSRTSLSETPYNIGKNLKVPSTDLSLRVSDLGGTKGNVVFAYLDAFDLGREGSRV